MRTRKSLDFCCCTAKMRLVVFKVTVNLIFPLNVDTPLAGGTRESITICTTVTLIKIGRRLEALAHTTM